jgi:hypothetical protein
MSGSTRPDHAGYLRDSLARATLLQHRAELRYGLPDSASESARWVNCAQLLAEPPAFDRWRKSLAGWLIDRYGEAPDRTTAGYVMYWYLFVPGYLAALLFHHERRVPSLRPEALAFRTAEPRPHPDAIAVLKPYFACLPDDPAAGTPMATVVADEHALAATLRARYIAHAGRFIRAFAPTSRFGRHTLWAVATDVLDSGLWFAGRYGGDEGAGVLDAELVLADKHFPLTSASTVYPVTHGSDHPRWSRRRESCCFHYLLEAGQGICETCPRLSAKRA